MPTCPVCGFPELKDPPRSASGGGSYEICPSCGFQFGVDDDDKGLSYEKARERWVAGGMKWHSRGLQRSEHWTPEAQLAALTSGGKAGPSHEHKTHHEAPPAPKSEAKAPSQENPKGGGGKWWSLWRR